MVSKDKKLERSVGIRWSVSGKHKCRQDYVIVSASVQIIPDTSC
jgi:hypothetical protein